MPDTQFNWTRLPIGGAFWPPGQRLMALTPRTRMCRRAWRMRAKRQRPPPVCGEVLVYPCRRCLRGDGRLALIVAGECVLRYDNETGKGDHRHLAGVETVYAFTGYETLLTDCWADVEAWRQRR
jgi:hypothetical protein